MKPKVDIIVPHYTEPWDVGEKLFSMIRMQRGIDFDDIRVTIVNDGGHRIQEEHLIGFPCIIRQIDIPHSGVSAARNAGTDAAEADWVMYCDFDDTFAGVYSLRSILEVLPADGMDMLWTKLVVEDRVGGNDIIYFTPDKQKFVFTHGKLYRRQFLIDENIRFTEGMTFQEDSEFNARIIARVHHSRIGEIKSPYPIYTWIRRQNSVTQSGRDDEATYGQFRRNIRVTEDNKTYKEEDHYFGMVTRTAWDTWFMINGTRISGETKRKIMEEFRPWIRENKDAFGKVTDDILRQIREMSRLELAEPGDIIPDDPAIVTAWVNSLTEGSMTDGDINN